MSTARFEVLNNSSEAIEPKLRYITHSRYDNEWLSAVHSHSVAEMLYILEGEGEIVVSGVHLKIQAGDFAVIPPHLMHTEISSSDNPLEYYCLGISDISIGFDGDDFNPIMTLGNSRQNVLNLIRNIYREMQKQQKACELMAKSYFYNLLSILIRRRIVSVGLDEEKVIRSNIADVKGYIDEHYAESFSLSGLADIAALSKFHLIRQFKSELGVSPVDYVLRKRVTEAKKLLSGTELSISDIAEAVGFSSGSYFSQRFRLATGMSPMSFRHNSHEMK